MPTADGAGSGVGRSDAVQDLGLDDFLAKLKAVTSRSNGQSLPARSGGSADATSERTYKSNLAELDAELDELKTRPDGSVMKRREPARAQRSAAPPQAMEDDVALISGDGGSVFTAGVMNVRPLSSNTIPQRGNIAASPQAEDEVALVSGDGTEVFSSGAAQSRPPAWSMSSQRPPANSAVGDNEQRPADIQNKISRMQKALAQSREMRASLVSMDMPTLPPQHFEMPSKTAHRAVRGAPTGNAPPAVVARSPRASYSPPVMQSQEMSRGQGQGQWSRESLPGAPPQLLRRSDAKPAPDSMGSAPLSEQQLLAQVSQYYGADPAVQNELWSLIADGAVRTPNQLRAAAQDQVLRRENRTPQMLQAVSSHSIGPQQPRSHHNQAGRPSPQQSGWRVPLPPHQQHLSRSIDIHGHQQAPGQLSSSSDFGAPRPRQQNTQSHLNGPQRQGPSSAAPIAASWGLPPAQEQAMMRATSRRQDHDILSRSFGEISKLAAAPAYGWGAPQPAPQAPSQPPMQNMQMPPRQPPPQMQQIMPAAPGHAQHTFGVMPRGPQANYAIDQPASATAPIIPVAALSSEEKYNLIDEGYNHGEMM